MSKMIDMKFGNLVVISAVNTNRFICQCDCGKQIEVWRTNLIQGKKTHCGCQKYLGRDLTGRRFGRWMVTGKHNGSVRCFDCRCDCGGEGVVVSTNLKTGNSQSCGCLQKERITDTGKKNLIDLVGQRFGRLVVLSLAVSLKNAVRWNCICDCGIKSVVHGSSLTKGNTKSCGCLSREVSRDKWINTELSEVDREANSHRRANLLYLEWRDKVLQRDLHQCQACGAKGLVDAHHKNAWASFPELRIDVGNGVTACRGCHNDFHSIYGRGKNTEVQWNEFVRTRPKLKDNSYYRVMYSVEIGGKYGKMTVIRKAESVKGASHWVCRCDCGNEKVVKGNSLKFGGVKSCGCLVKHRKD